MSVDHYENFPVASVLCPPALRPPIKAIYWFARTADDIADEGNATIEARLAYLHAYRDDLHAVAAGQQPSPRWPGVFGPLRNAIETFGLPVALLDALLSAFEQDLTKQRYADRADLLDYCDRSANPVGRLLLHLHGIADADSLRHSDAICTALQLINFWQDLGTDVGRDRLYIPLSDCRQQALQVASLMSSEDTPALRRVVKSLATWSRALMQSGEPLVHRMPGRSGWELRLVIQGGLRILDKIEHNQYAVLQHRPTLKFADAPALMWRALGMRLRPVKRESKAA